MTSARAFILYVSTLYYMTTSLFKSQCVFVIHALYVCVCIVYTKYIEYLNGKYSEGFPMGAIKPIAVFAVRIVQIKYPLIVPALDIRNECYIFIKVFFRL